MWNLEVTGFVQFQKNLTPRSYRVINVDDLLGSIQNTKNLS